MNIKLLLSGVLLLSLLAACSDRNDELPSSPAEQSKVSVFSKNSKESTEETAKTETDKIVDDSLKTKEIINATQQGIPTVNPDGTTTQQVAEDTGETIDPTKPDRPK
ncbi:hypothetical protein [Chryseobacterium taeanense]|uniref:Uncharacterized protein n=1 Tax=Chryseobacterium taeanense TaxID=311334 RepID=A0A1G8F9R5_9FLAO|nr:hypothetical protein [Chryseobacterium taeanense]SDH78842.1 hypothetical protein SAMN05421846_10257 [Chryseobacterium taeanense]